MPWGRMEGRIITVHIIKDQTVNGQWQLLFINCHCLLMLLQMCANAAKRNFTLIYKTLDLTPTGQLCLKNRPGKGSC